MSLILIPGASGSGKSHMLFEMVLREAQHHPDRRYIVLVPEQNTLQTQKRLVSMSGRGGIWNIDVLSFTRLAYRVFEQTGVERRQVLSETGKVLLLRLIAARESERIPILSGILDRPGSLEEMKSILSEMDQYGIGPEDLKGMGHSVQETGSHPALVRKLSEIALVQEAYERYQEGHFITGEKLPLVLSRKAPLDETLQGAALYLDGFTGLTPAQLEVITVLLGIVRDIYVTVTIDPGEILPGAEKSGNLPGAEKSGNLSGAEKSGNQTGAETAGYCRLGEDDCRRIRQMHASDHELFALPKRTIQSLLDCADRARVCMQILPVPEGRPLRHSAGGELAHLERHFLRAGRKGACPYPAEAEDAGRHEIFLRQCADPMDEAVSAAVTIEGLIRDGVRCRDIAIVCGSLKDYAEYVRRSMDVYGIPCYIDRSTTVVMNPAFEFVSCAVEILEKNYSYESVMAFLRTGLALEAESGQIDLLENYILAAGIRGHGMWSNSFTRPAREGGQVLRDASETARTSFMERFEPFASQMKSGRALFREYAGAVWNLLLAFDVPSKLAVLSSRAAEEGREDRAQEYAQVLRVISEVLDEAALLMGSESVTRKQFAGILEAGFSEAKIGILPRGIDQVQVADLERSRLEQVSVVLFLGLNDGFVPRRKRTGGVLTDLEREYLRTRRVHLAPTAREDAGIQQFSLYLTFARPSQALYLSWSLSGRNGEQMRPSGILRNLQAMFPSAAWADASSRHPYESITSLRTAETVLAQELGDYLHADRLAADWSEPKLRELINLFRRQGRDAGMGGEAYLKHLAGGDSWKDLEEDTALALYGTVLKGSITRLEEFSACAFRHFADYGLKLREREEFTIRTLDIGNLLHSAIEIFSGKLRDGSVQEDGKVLTWRTMTQRQMDSLARESLRQALMAQQGQDLYEDTRRSSQTLERCERALLRSVKTIQRQICQSAFEPAMFEFSFGGSDPDGVWTDDLPGGRKMRIGGKIDRIDECLDDGTGRVYVKVIDYKSSQREMDLDSLIDGEQLQLVVYLDAAARLEQKIHPDREIVCAGAFYFAFQENVIDLKPDMTDAQIEDAVVAGMKVKGLVNGREDVVKRLDTGLTDAGPSLVIPVIRNKNPGELRASECVMTDRQFSLLRAYARDRMKKTAVSILSGRITPNPSRKNQQLSACTWCPYRDVCGFDPRRKGMGYREKEKRSSAEKWEIIARAVSPDSGPKHIARDGGAHPS